MIEITPEIKIDPSEIKFTAMRASGPGGQHVNKTSTAVQLRFHLEKNRSIPEAVKERLVRQQRSRISNEGILTVNACSYRSQLRNREEALSRLIAFIRKAAIKPVIRKKTRPGRTARENRLEKKHKRSLIKQNRKPIEY